MALAARAEYPVSFQQWAAIDATPLDFRLGEGAYGLTTRATVWGTATLQRVMLDAAGTSQTVTDVVPAIAGNGYVQLVLPAGWYRLTLAGVTGLTGLIERIGRANR